MEGEGAALGTEFRAQLADGVVEGGLGGLGEAESEEGGAELPDVGAFEVFRFYGGDGGGG